MANDSFIQGFPLKFTIDLTDLGVFSDVKFELYVSATKQTIATAKYLTPTIGQYPITKVGNIYSFTFPEAVTEYMLGDYGIELTYYDSNGNTIDKAQVGGITYDREAK